MAIVLPIVVVVVIIIFVVLIIVIVFCISKRSSGVNRSKDSEYRQNPARNEMAEIQPSADRSKDVVPPQQDEDLEVEQNVAYGTLKSTMSAEN